MQNPEIDPVTGDYVLQGGSPKQTDSLRIPAYIRLKTQRQKWLYAPDNNYGSDLYLIRRRKTNQDTGFIEATAARAIQPMVDDGRAAAIQVTAETSYRTALGLTTDIVDAQGDIERLNIPGLGG